LAMVTEHLPKKEYKVLPFNIILLSFSVFTLIKYGNLKVNVNGKCDMWRKKLPDTESATFPHAFCGAWGRLPKCADEYFHLPAHRVRRVGSFLLARNLT